MTPEKLNGTQNRQDPRGSQVGGRALWSSMGGQMRGSGGPAGLLGTEWPDVSWRKPSCTDVVPHGVGEGPRWPCSLLGGDTSQSK